MNERLKNNIAILRQHNLTHEPVYHITDGHKHEVDLINEIVEDCEEIFNDEEQGLIKRFPCKVGTIVYTIRKEDWTAEYTMVASMVKGFSDCGDGLGLRFILPFGSPAVSLIGDRIFFACPEAEKKLAELKKENK